MVYTVIKVKDLFEAGFCGLVLASHSVVALVKLGFVRGAVVLSAGLLDSCCWVNQVLEQNIFIKKFHSKNISIKEYFNKKNTSIKKIFNKKYFISSLPPPPLLPLRPPPQPSLSHWS